MNIPLKKIFYLAALFVFIVFPTQYSHAVSNDSVSLRVSPTIPGPNTQVFLELQSYETDLNRVEILWYKDNQLVLSGIGEKKYSFETGGNGKSTKINAYIKTGKFQQIEIERTFVPAEVDLLWEAIDSYTPPFYKGKALPASQAKIRITALPNMKAGGKNLDPNTLVYKWKKDGKYREFNDQSGYGKTFVEYYQNLFAQSERIVAEVSSLNSVSRADGSITLKRTTPELVFYEKSPTEGVRYEKALESDFSGSNMEIEIVAEPYFFSLANENMSSLEFDWRMNNKKVEGVSGNVVVFGFSENENTTSKISLSIKHLTNILQSTKKSFSLEHGENSSNPSFGI